MTTVRTPKVSDRPGFSMPRTTAQDGKRSPGRLSFEARGILAYLLSKPDDWEIQRADLMAEGGIGRDKVNSILKELREAGYLVTEIQRDDEGKITGTVYRLYESANRSTEKASYGDAPFTENPQSGNRSTEKPADGKTGGRQNRTIHKREKKQNTEKRVAPAVADASPISEPTPEQLFTQAVERAAGMPAAPVSVNAVAKTLADAPVRPSAKRGAKPADPENDAIVALIDAWLKISGTIDPAAFSKKPYRNSARAMHHEGITAAHVIAYTPVLCDSDYWRGKSVPFTEVAKGIKAWLKSRADTPSGHMTSGMFAGTIYDDGFWDRETSGGAK